MTLRLTFTCAFMSCGLIATAAHGATIALTANGDLQAAINSAQPGDVITLPGGATYVGNFVLPAKTNPKGLTITIKSAANPSNLPPAGQRVMPTNANRLPNIAECAAGAPDGGGRPFLAPAVSRVPRQPRRVWRHRYPRLRRPGSPDEP
jgi:hypothetical protein